MNDERDDEVFERRMAAALREERGERVPDVTAAVLARAAAGEFVDDVAPATARSTTRWLAAACVFLLGIMTVFAVAWSQSGRADGAGNSDDGGWEEAQQPVVAQLREVAKIGDIATLPRDLKAVELRNLEDAAVAALVARCPDLEHLRVFASTAYKRAGDDPAQSITDAALPHIAKLTKLRELELHGVVLVKGPGLQELTALPLLDTLTLGFFDVVDDELAFLARMPSLRDLTISHNDAFAARGWEAVGECVGLRRLTVRAGGGNKGARMEPLRKLRLLDFLCLEGVGLWARGVADEDVARRFGLGMRFQTPRTGNGVTEELLSAWPNLRELRVDHANDLGSSVGAFLRDNCPALQRVQLEHCALVSDETIGDLLGMPTLRVLMIGGCHQVTAAVLPKLEAARHLVSVDLSGNYWPSLVQVRRLMATGKDVTFVRKNDPEYQQAMQQVRQEYQHLFQGDDPNLVRTVGEIKALPKSTTRIALRGLGNRAAALLGRFANLRHVEVVRDDEDPFTTAGLQAMAALPKLEQLELNNLPRLESDALLALGNAPSLHTLDIIGCNVNEPALRTITGLHALRSLSLVGVRTFGLDGAKAIGSCIRLQTLDLTGCDQLTGEAIAQLGTLTDLETLNLSNLPKLSDSALMGLQKLTKLRELRLGAGTFSSMGMQALADMRGMKVLQLSGNPNLVTSALLLLPTTLESLDLDECPGIGADAGTLLRDRFPKLRWLQLGGNKHITDAALAAILQNPSLQRLDIRDCSALTAASFATIRDAHNLRELDATRAACLTDATAAELQRLRPELKVTRKIW